MAEAGRSTASGGLVVADSNLEDQRKLKFHLAVSSSWGSSHSDRTGIHFTPDSRYGAASRSTIRDTYLPSVQEVRTSM
jgi:hypothetical protein